MSLALSDLLNLEQYFAKKETPTTRDKTCHKKLQRILHLTVESVQMNTPQSIDSYDGDDIQF